ncbi:MAG TPA: M1 family metallopeptidase [Gemmatimonadales bacterium]|nr:M1 family metallopeptidase [Gemmatimonadales bacterium]
MTVSAIRALLAGAALTCASGASAQQVTGHAAATADTFTHADTVRGSITPERAWWDVTFYDLRVAIDPADSTLRGSNAITYRVTGMPPHAGRGAMQIDLQAPLAIDSVTEDGHRLDFRRDGNTWFVTPAAREPRGRSRTVTVYYHGRPRVAARPPWDGGLVWARDSAGAPWIGTASEGIGASIWWPNKDTWADEPDSQRTALTVPDSLQAIANGRLRTVTPHGDGTTTWEWVVTNPINNYDVAAYAGHYAELDSVYQGERGPLTLAFRPLAAHVDTARVQFRQVAPMLQCFEHWFGPYPWYRDGYQLVESPYLGMEHQSAVAYGNDYLNGYLGRDLSGTGWGLRWDFIIVHESAHEWWGNNITAADIADMWIHEAFAAYAEALYTECRFGKAAGAAYVIGTRKRIENDRPIVGHYGVNDEGSGDMYYKGANMLHTIRQLVGNDSTWRAVLRGLNQTFRHRVVTGRQVEEYMSAHTGVDLSRVFAQYLTTTKVPTLEYRLSGDTLSYRWTDVVPGFDMPVRVTLGGDRTMTLEPRETWRSAVVAISAPEQLSVDDDYYVRAASSARPPGVTR